MGRSTDPTGQPLGSCGRAPQMPIPHGTEGRLPFLLYQVGEAIAWAADELLPAAGLDARGYCILTILSADDGPGSQQELAALLGLGAGVMVAEIDQLEQAGLVQRNRDPADRRRSRVTPTARGLEALERADALADEMLVQLLPGLDQTDRAGLLALLNRGLQREPASASTSL